jgi:alpha-tubulin suppressor-like RCC1 family protein
MPSNFTYPILDASGNSTTTTVDFQDMFAKKDYFLNGGLWVSGTNAYGQLGIGNVTSNSSAIQVGTLKTWRQIVGSENGGVNFTAALKTDGTLWTWGYNQYGQLGNGTTTNYSSPIQIGTLTNWKTISCGNSHTVALKTDGTLWAWGYNFNGQLGNGNTTYYSSPIQVGSLTTWKQIATGQITTYAIKTDGTLWAWGRNALGELGNGNTTDYSSPIQIGSLTDWKIISSGYSAVAAIKTNGTLWVWGRNDFSQLGLNVAGATIPFYSSPTQVGSLTDWKTVSITYTAAAIKTDGTLWTWGFGQALGNGTTTTSSSPIQIGSLTDWKTINGGYNCFLSIKKDGTLWGWGFNANGQLLNGTTTSYSSPIQIGTLTNWKYAVAPSVQGFAIGSPDLP